MPPAPGALKNALIFAEVKQWNVSTVCHWLDSVDISEAKQHFERDSIDGMKLIKLGKENILTKVGKLKKPKKDLLSRYLDELDNEIKNQACSFHGSFARTVQPTPTPPAMNVTHKVESGDEEDFEEDDEWDNDEIYENTEQVTPETVVAPPIPGRNGPMPPPPRGVQVAVPPPPMRSPTTKISTRNSGSDDDENYEVPSSVAPVPSRTAAVPPASRPVPPQPLAGDEYYEATVIKQDDETYEATEDYVESPSTMKPTSLPPTSPRGVPPPHSGPSRPPAGAPPNPQLPPRCGLPAQPPLPSRNNQPQPTSPAGRGLPQLPVARTVPQPTSIDEEVYEVAEESPPQTPRSRVPDPPAVYSIEPPSVPNRGVPAVPAADDDMYLAPDAQPTPAKHVPPPVPSGISSRATPPVPSAGRQNIAGAPPLPNRGGRPVPAAPVVEELYEPTDASDQLCYEATDEYTEKNAPAKKTGTNAPPILPPGRLVNAPVQQEEVYEVTDEIYEETDDDKPKQPALPGRSVHAVPPQPPQSNRPQAAPPVLPGRRAPAPVAVDEDTYEATDEPSEYADPDSLVITGHPAPPPLPSARNQRQSASDEDSASSHAFPPRKPASLPDARLPAAESGRASKPIPVSGALTAMVGSDTIKVMKNRLRPVAAKTFPSDTAPGSPPCREQVDSQPTAPGGPLAFKLKPVTPREPQAKAPTSPSNEATTVVLKSPTTLAAVKSPPPVVPKTRQQPLSPVIANNDRPPERGMLHKTDPLSKFSWYFGDINREDATRKIQNMRREGAFLVRKSDKDPEFPYTLTVYHNDEVFNIQLRERFEDKKFALGKKKPKEHVHSTIEDLIKFHANNEIEVTKLSGPCGGVKLTVNPPK